MNKKISVALASYNGEKFIGEQIDSILDNLRKNDELIVSDDGSTDNTISIVSEYQEKDDRVKLLHNAHGGVIKNFENALTHCSGDYIFLSDQDDIWLPNKVDTVIPLLEKNTLVCHNAIIFNSDTSEQIGSIQDKIGTNKTIFKNIIKNSFIGCCMAFRRELLDVVLPFPDREDIHIHDWWIGLMAIKKGDVYFEKQSLLKYRIHSGNTLGFNKTTLRFKIKKRYRMIKTLWRNK